MAPRCTCATPTAPSSSCATTDARRRTLPTARHRRHRGTVRLVNVHGPERLAGQGLDSEQHDSGNRAIHALLSDSGVGAQVDLVLTWRAGDDGEHGAYEAWATRAGALSKVDRRRRHVAVRGDRGGRPEPSRQSGPAGTVHARRRTSRRNGRRVRLRRPHPTIHRTRAAELPLRLRARRSAVRFAQRTGSCRLTSGLVLRFVTRHSWRAARAPVASALVVQWARRRRGHPRSCRPVHRHRSHLPCRTRLPADRR